MSAPPAGAVLRGDAYPHAATGITTRPFVLRNRHGQHIRGFVQHASGTAPDAPVVVAAAGMGVTMRRTLLPAFYLLGSGFRVVRYDPTNATGIGDGSIIDYTVTRSHDDLADVLSFVREEFPGVRLGVFAASLTARAAIRVAAAEPGLIDVLGSIACVANVRATVEAVTGEDRIGRWLAGEIADRRATAELFDDVIRWEAFAGIAEDGWDTLASTCRELAAATRTRFVNVHGEHDPWVRTEDMREAFAAARDARLIVLGGAVHELNFATARVALGRLCTELVAVLRDDPDFTPPAEPEFDQYVALNKAERGWEAVLRTTSLT